MIDSLVKAVEKVTQLLEVREKRKKEVFEKVIAPLYTALAPVHVDYRKMFDQCEERLRANDEPLEQLISSFRKDKEANDHTRRTLRATAQVFEKRSLDEPFKQFFVAVNFYLASPQTTWARIDPEDERNWIAALHADQSSRASVFFRHLQKVHRDLEGTTSPMDEDLLRSGLVFMVSMIQEESQRRWSNISERYAEAIAHALSV